MSAERSAGCDVYMYSLLKQTRQVGDVHECCDVERKLEENRQEHVKVEDVPKRPFSGQFLNRLNTMVSATIDRGNLNSPLRERCRGNRRT